MIDREMVFAKEFQRTVIVYKKRILDLMLEKRFSDAIEMYDNFFDYMRRVELLEEQNFSHDSLSRLWKFEQERKRQ